MSKRKHIHCIIHACNQHTYLPTQMLVLTHIGTNNKLYSYNMNTATLKTVDVERDLGVIISKNC